MARISIAQEGSSAKILFSKIMLQREKFKDGNIIILEGGLDYSFFEKFNKNTENRFIEINELRKNEGFSTPRNILTNTDVMNNENTTRYRDPNKELPNNKQDILNAIKDPFNLQVIRNRRIYAVVDRDFDDNIYSNDKYPFIIFTDSAHDTETMMLYTSNDRVLEEHYLMEKHSLDLKKVYYMAYQLALVREVWRHINYKIKPGLDVLEFGEYFKNENLELNKFFKHVCKKNPNNSMGWNEFLAMCKDFLNKEEKFKITYENFKLRLPEDFYFKVNGHDICNLCLYELRDEIDLREYEKYRLEREMIQNYSISDFHNSVLYNSMKRAKLL